MDLQSKEISGMDKITQHLGRILDQLHRIFDFT